MLLTSTAGSQAARGALWIPALLLSSSLPALLAYNLPPSSTMLNQCLAVGLWGGVVATVAPSSGARNARVLLAILLLMLAAVIGSGVFGALPLPLTTSAAALVLAALAVAWAGSAAAQRDERTSLFSWFAIGLLAAGVLSTIVALVQVFVPSLADGDWIAVSGLPGRAVGNLRQPNHLCSLLLWGVIAAVALHELRVLRFGATAALVTAMVFAVELSASRTGALGLGLLALWGVLDKRLSNRSRALLLATPLIYALSYGAMALYGQWSDQAFGAAARIAADGGSGIESPNSRRRIWANALALIAQHPWLGVGFGEFNFAWSLTPFPGRPTAFFDHTHTLPLQLAVELGLPLATLVMGLMGLALWQGWRRSSEASGDDGTSARAAWMLVLLIGLHSLSEYPLWYAYFLLPAAFAWGYALGAGRAPAPPALARSPATGAAWAGRIAGVALAAGAAYGVIDYLRIVDIYAPGERAGPLEERIAAGQRSLLFGHHADYAAATGSEPTPGTPLAFQRAPHYLLDTRLMIAWARYLDEHGQPDLARSLAERLREFRNSASDEFLKPCSEGAFSNFQCQPPQRPQAWRDYLEQRPK